MHNNTPPSLSVGSVAAGAGLPAAVPACAVLVINAHGELLVAASHRAGAALPGATARRAEAGCAAAWRGLLAAAGHAGGVDAAPQCGLQGAGVEVVLHARRGTALRLFGTQATAARALGDAAVASGAWQWLRPALLEELECSWALRRCLQVYGTAFRGGVVDQGRPSEDSSAAETDAWAPLLAAFPAGDPREGVAELAAWDSELLGAPRPRLNNHERLLRRSAVRRVRARRAGPVSGAQAAALAAQVAEAAGRAAVAAQGAVAATYAASAERAAAAKRKRAALHHEGAEEETAPQRADWWSQTQADLVDLSSLVQSVRARVAAGRSRTGVSDSFRCGLPHKEPHRTAWLEEVRAQGRAKQHIVQGISWPFAVRVRLQRMDDRRLEGAIGHRGRWDAARNCHLVTLLHGGGEVWAPPRCQREVGTAQEDVVPERIGNLASVLSDEIPPAPCTETLSPRAWTTQAIEELAHFEVVRQVAQRPTLCCALSMALKGSGRYRLCLDLRPLNKYLRKLRFTLESLQRVRHCFQRDDWLITIDMQAAYHNFCVREDHTQYCGFEWQGKYFEYCGLSFGSSAAPHAFQALMDEVARHIRGQGVRCGVYLDDWWFAFQSRSAAQAFAGYIQGLFSRLGLCVNAAKSVLEPVQRLRILGIDVDTRTFTFHVPEKRVAAVEQGAAELLELARAGHEVGARALATVVGRIMSCWVALGTVTRRLTRRCYAALAAATGVEPDAPLRVLKAAWGCSLALPGGAQAELAFWLEELRGCAIRGAPITSPGSGTTLRSWEVAAVACSDASDWAVGSWMQPPCSAAERRVLGRERLEMGEDAYSSTRRELLGCLRTLLAQVGPGAAQLQGCELLFLIDNQGAALGLDMGSKQPELHTIIMRCHQHCARHQVSLVPAWAQRDTPEVAWCDMQSKRRDDQDWQLDPAIFRALDADARFGGAAGHSVDMFAGAGNAQLRRFWARWGCRGAEAVGAFKQCWRHENGFANPPFVLIARVVAEARQRGAALTLVCQQDPQRLWWPLVRLGAPGVVAHRSFSNKRCCYSVAGRPVLRPPRCKPLAVRFDFTLERRERELRERLLGLSGAR